SDFEHDHRVEGDVDCAIEDPQQSVRCGFGQETFAGAAGNGQEMRRLQTLLPSPWNGEVRPLRAFLGPRPWMVGPARERTFVPGFGTCHRRLTPVRRAAPSRL